jgi:hypothetical protein
MTPTAWYDPSNGAVSTDKDSPLFTPLGQVLPLYLQRTWLGLTDEEVKNIVWNLPYEPSQEHIRTIEAALRSKNT